MLVRVTPLHADLGDRVTFVSLPGRDGSWSLLSTPATEVIRAVPMLSAPQPRELMVEALAAARPGVDWRRLVARLVDAGYLETITPLPCSFADSEAWADTARRWGNCSMRECAEILDWVCSELDVDPAHPPVLEDLVFDDPALSGCLPNVEELRQELAPLAGLARASMTDTPHDIAVDAFRRLYPREAVVPVPEVLMRLLEVEELGTLLRWAWEPPAWIASTLPAHVGDAAADVVQLPTHVFEELPGVEGLISAAAFLEVNPSRAIPGGQACLVLNGLQAGRGKYLSRYLANDPPAAALEHLRSRLSARRLLPIDMTPLLDSTLQDHPPLAPCALAMPRDPVPAGQVVRLDELTLRLSGDQQELHMRSERLGQDVELLNLGFVRDVALPTPLLFLRALCRSVREDTVAERAALYDVLDAIDIRQAGTRFVAGRACWSAAS